MRALFFLWLAIAAQAHEGPPFPIWVDRAAPGGTVSVWADPDLGEGTVYVAVDGAHHDPRVQVTVRPVSGRLPPAVYAGERMPLKRVQFAAHPQFDRQELWTLTVEVEPGVRWTTTVEATPPGAGAWDLVIYAFPFACFGAIWVRTLIRRRESSRTSRTFCSRACAESRGR